MMSLSEQREGNVRQVAVSAQIVTDDHVCTLGGDWSCTRSGSWLGMLGVLGAQGFEWSVFIALGLRLRGGLV